MRFVGGLVALVLVGGAAFFVLTRPAPLPEAELAGLAGDATRGETLFWAAGCASCHAAPEAEGDDKLVLAGGREFPSPFGTFVAPNISQHPEAGIGAWTNAEIVNAMLRGVSPDGRHYYPAFPYTSYAKMALQDAVDLAAYLQTLPASDTPSRAHDLPIHVQWRRPLGGWKLFFQSDDWALQDVPNETVKRGRYLSEALAHCGECHTPRGPLGALDTARWMAGAPVPGSARGRVPNITPAELDWSEAEIVEYLTSGFTPEYDTAGGHMVEVVENMARLPEEDRAAVAAYLKALAPIPD